MSGPIKRHKYKPPKGPNKKSNLDDSFDPGQEYWSNAETSPPSKKSKRFVNVNLLKQAAGLNMGNSCFGFTHRLAEQELVRLFISEMRDFVLTLNLLLQEEENPTCDDRSNSDSDEESEKDESSDDSGDKETTEGAKDSPESDSDDNLMSTEKVSTERDDQSEIDNVEQKSSKSSSSDDEEMTENMAKMRRLLEAKMQAKYQAKLEAKLAKYKVIHFCDFLTLFDQLTLFSISVQAERS